MACAAAWTSVMSRTEREPDPLESREQQQLAAARAGDGRAFRALVEPHLAMLYRIAARASAEPALAEEAVQETLATVFRHLGRYRPGTSFKAFLAAVAARRAHTLARAERRRRSRERAARAPARPPTPEEQLRGAQLASQLRAAVLAMPPKRQAAALLRYDAGLSYRDIAQALSTSEGAARVLVHEATKQLREQLAEQLDDD
jgi:RNA polymerase sigma-70 factor (ECF subfamily)